MRAIILAHDGRAALAKSKATGMALIGHVVEALFANRIVEVVVCVGSHGRRVREVCMLEHPQLLYHFVPMPRTSQEIGGTLGIELSREHFEGDEDVLLIEGDVGFGQGLLETVLKTKGSVAAVDAGKYEATSWKVSAEGDRIVGFSKQAFREEALGLSVGVFRFAHEEAAMILEEVQRSTATFSPYGEAVETLLDRLCVSGQLALAPCAIGDAKWRRVSPPPPAAEQTTTEMLERLTGE